MVEMIMLNESFNTIFKLTMLLRGLTGYTNSKIYKDGFKREKIKSCFM